MRALIQTLEGRTLLAGNLLINGDFETPNIGNGASGQGFTTYATNSAIGTTGWKVTAGSVDVVRNAAGTTYATKPASGSQCIDLDGLQPGTISQNVTTVVGRRYLLRLAYTATPFVGDGAATRTATVSFGGKTVVNLSKAVAGLTPQNAGWSYVEYLVVATSTTSAVTIKGTSPGSLGIAVDNVSLTEMPFGTASIAGQVFADGNGDGIKGTDAIGLSGWTVYIDTNNNGKLDTNEISAVTDRFGNYTIGSLAAGSYKLRVVQQTNWKLTTPAPLSITLTAGQKLTNKLFGEQPI
jgi:uncharacterized protein (DUF2141 family)